VAVYVSGIDVGRRWPTAT